jgi:Asp-tRNA(Asn)/Glu-tRNA(Gln) amidotransferase C subunit
MDNWENGIKVDDDITAKHQLEHFMDVFVDHFEEKKEKFEKLSSVPSSANNLQKLTQQWKTVVDRFSQIKISLENAVEMESHNCEQLSMERARHSSSSLPPND